MFDIYMDNFKKFKDTYYLVIPYSYEARESMCWYMQPPRKREKEDI